MLHVGRQAMQGADHGSDFFRSLLVAILRTHPTACRPNGMPTWSTPQGARLRAYCFWHPASPRRPFTPASRRRRPHGAWPVTPARRGEIHVPCDGGARQPPRDGWLAVPGRLACRSLHIPLPGDCDMAIQLNHTIVFSRDKKVSADFLCEILGRPAAVPFGPFLAVRLDNDVTLDFMDAEGDVALQH